MTFGQRSRCSSVASLKRRATLRYSSPVATATQVLRYSSPVATATQVLRYATVLQAIGEQR